MGVPKFAAWLRKKYPSLVVDKCPDDVHGLYIDLNGLIHPCCHSEHDPSVALRTQEEKLRSICLAIETLVVTVRPKHVIYIAVDGVAPRAKMNQQRARRYMRTAVPLTDTDNLNPGCSPDVGAAMVAAMEKEFTRAECDKAERDLDDVRQALMGDVLYGGDFLMTPESGRIEEAGPGTSILGTVEAHDEVDMAGYQNSRQRVPSPPPPEFDSNCISPGTAFMDSMVMAVRDYICRKLAPRTSETRKSSRDERETSRAIDEADNPAYAQWEGRTVIFSDSNTAGEGEHKLIDFLRTQSAFPGFNGRGCHVIAGLDADLIFLSLALHIPHVYILRDFKRSSYNQSSYPSSSGITVHENKAPTRGTQRGSQGAVVASLSSTSSQGSTAVPTAAEEKNVMAVCGAARASSRRSTAPSSPVQSVMTTPTTASPQSVAEMVVERCTSYEYFDVDVVGASVVSEVYQLCVGKGMQIRGNPLDNTGNSVAANGFRFHHGSGGGSAQGKGRTAFERNRLQGDTQEGTPKPQPTPFHPCTWIGNSKIIDDFIVLSILLGNDFLPHLPSVFCGESAMDTLLDVYVTAVLPYGYLTGGEHEIQLVQLERFLRAYAAVEALRFRHFSLQSGVMTPQEAATAELCSRADRRCWRDKYVRTTSLRDESGVQEACRSYVEGVRFVWRYYSSVALEVSWGWYFPFHHAPLALDIANFLHAQGPHVQKTLAAPKLEQRPPSPFAQLLCILPPQSCYLLPECFRRMMISPPSELAESFPHRWTVDFTGAYGKDHLAAVVLPFANFPRLQEVVIAAEGTYTSGEHQRNTLRSGHLVFNAQQSHTLQLMGISSSAMSPASATGKSSTDPGISEQGDLGPSRESQRAPPQRTVTCVSSGHAVEVRVFRIQGSGLRVLSAEELPADMRNRTSVGCFCLEDITPPLSRPRTYSYTVPIPGLTAQPDGGRRKAEKKRWPRSRESAVRPSKNEIAGAAAENTADLKSPQPALLFGEFVMCLAGMSVFTAGVTMWRPSSLPTLLWSLQMLLQLFSIAFTVVWITFALGLAVVPKPRTAGVGIQRNKVSNVFVDWQCSVCLSLNFQRNLRCFMCRAPYDPHRCLALFSTRCPAVPPLMDPDHSAYTVSYGTAEVV